MDKKYLAILLIALVLAVVAGLLFLGPSIVPRGRFTGPTTINLQLHTGWNFISAPYKDFSLADSECMNNFDPETGTGNIDGVYHYSNGRYSSLSGIQSISSGLGYWVYSNSGCTLTFSGSIPVTTSDLGDSSNGALGIGFNQIGGTTEAVNLIDKRGDCSSYPSEILADIPAGQELDIYYYDTQATAYSKVTNIEPGKAYWVIIDSACQLASAPVDTEGTPLLANGTFVDNDGNLLPPPPDFPPSV